MLRFGSGSDRMDGYWGACSSLLCQKLFRFWVSEISDDLFACLMSCVGPCRPLISCADLQKFGQDKYAEAVRCLRRIVAQLTGPCFCCKCGVSWPTMNLGQTQGLASLQLQELVQGWFVSAVPCSCIDSSVVAVVLPATVRPCAGNWFDPRH